MINDNSSFKNSIQIRHTRQNDSFGFLYKIFFLFPKRFNRDGFYCFFSHNKFMAPEYSFNCYNNEERIIPHENEFSMNVNQCYDNGDYMFK